MTRIETALTRLLGIDLPIVQAGMSWASSAPELPLAVSRAGGLGVLAAGPMRPDDLRSAIRTVRAGTDRPFAVNLPLYRKGVEETLELLLAERPPVLIASQGGPRRYLDRFHDAGVLCLHVVAGPEHARKAAAAGVDGLVVVGAEAGGHPPPDLVSTLVLARAVAAAVPATPFLVSGGFADGHGLAAALALGAGAAQFGTRFLLSTEANVHPAYQRAVLAASVADPQPVGRDLGVIRAIPNAFTREMHRLEADGAALEDRRTRFSASTLKMAAFDGDVDRGKIEAGQSAGLIGEIRPAGEIVRTIATEYETARRSLPEAR
ncbi:NAD(P)H-dependent flavin oxidoreductase [Amycolatopsis jiangsuensis]|uniref:Enoyl-[acyl-carrier protein] reductase II n=1 Tax=Amycolatopsis jiangsuensis TaxID=1181879 RepID=A0A840ISC5_9PSEU|nr:nitronate monooxygenase family protein [Amycolatopsis jiangsuensis]MBB4684102.1 enoyl-[acyl-carrier protein] reductase II [Amycolatopsis jiangsuensis]